MDHQSVERSPNAQRGFRVQAPLVSIFDFFCYSYSFNSYVFGDNTQMKLLINVESLKEFLVCASVLMWFWRYPTEILFKYADSDNIPGIWLGYVFLKSKLVQWFLFCFCFFIFCLSNYAWWVWFLGFSFLCLNYLHFFTFWANCWVGFLEVVPVV